MSPRRPLASPRSTALPTLVALLAAGVSVEGCATEAQAQPRPTRDAGVVRPHPIAPVPPPPVHPPGGISPVHPHPPVPPHPPAPPTPTPPQAPHPEPPLAVPGGMGKVAPGR